MNRSDILFPVIEYYLGHKIEYMEKDESSVYFVTEIGRGEIIQNILGNWDIYIEGEKIEEIENCVYEMVSPSVPNTDTQKYYNDLKTLLNVGLTNRSKRLIQDIMGSLEYLLLNENVVIRTPLVVDKYFLFTLDKRKEIVCLN